MKEIILINITGDDKPGLTASITQILSNYDVNILDISQSVIHASLSLGILVEVAAAAESSLIVESVLASTQDLGLTVRFSPIDVTTYEAGVEGQDTVRHIITLLSRQITAEQLSVLTAVVAKHGLNIDRIKRLSGRVSLARTNSDKSKACVEFSVLGRLLDTAGFRAELMRLANDHDMDIAIQEDNIFRRNRRLAVFDMDSTLIEAEVIDELAKAAGVGEQVAAITERAMLGELDFTESFKERVALLKGLDESVLQSIAKNLPVTEGAATLISSLKQMGYKTAILSGGFNYFGNYLQSLLGVDYVYANDLDIVDGKVTGKVTGRVVDGARKAELLREIATREGISLDQSIAVGDGANDLPMLSIAGLGVAFRAKPLVKESAKHSISTLGLDGVLYLLGLSDRYLK